MAFNVADFKAQVAKRGLSRTNKFMLTAPWPETITRLISKSYLEPTSGLAHLNAASDMAFTPVQMLSMYCDTVTFPGKSIDTIDYKPQGFGKIVKLPTGVTFDQLQSTIMLDSKQEIRKFLEMWQETVINTSSDQRGEMTSSLGKTPYEMGYRKSYSVQGHIDWFADDIGIEPDPVIRNARAALGDGNAERRALRLVLKDMYPVQIGSVTLSWSETDQIATLPVQWAYTSYHIEEINIPIEVANSRGTTVFQDVVRLGSIAGTLNSLDKPRSIQDAINTISRIDNVFRNLDSIF